MRITKSVSLVVGIVAVLAVGAAPASALEVLYVTSWSGNSSQVNWGIIDHVLHAFAIPDAGGGASVGGNPSTICSAAHSNGKKCSLSYGGWNNGNDSGFEGLAASSSGRTNFANTCLNHINSYGLDGVDMDWEYPEAEKATIYGQMCDAINARIGTKMLTAATANHGYNADAVRANRSKLDFVMIMSYDGGDGSLHSPMSYAQTAMSYWGTAILGVPFYGRPSWAAYKTLRAAGCPCNADRCTYQGMDVWYNGQPTIRAKRALGGVTGIMAWESSQDTAVGAGDSLQLAMNGQGNCSGGTATPTPTPNPTATPTPNPSGTPGPTATPTTGGGGGTCWAAWSASQVYVGGNQASRNCGGNKNYQAAYWTQGNDPCTNNGPQGSGEEWIPMGSCN
jgi:hypothetical protein